MKATNKWGTSPIKKEAVADTIRFVGELLDIPIDDLHPLGSTGKKEESGDIDLAIDSRKYELEPIHEKMMEGLEGKGLYNKGTHVGSYAVPIAGNPSNGLAQVDLMLVEHVPFAQFSYHSPKSGQSAYKGAVRTILLMAIASTMDVPGVDYMEYEGDLLIVKAGRTFDLSHGLRRIFQYRPFKKKGGGYLKNLKTVSDAEFVELFPQKQTWYRSFETVTDPAEIIEMMFGEDMPQVGVNTAEQVFDLIMTNFPIDRQKLIFSIADEKMRRSDLEVPEEIQRFMDIDHDYIWELISEMRKGECYLARAPREEVDILALLQFVNSYFGDAKKEAEEDRFPRLDEYREYSLQISNALRNSK